MTGSFLKTAVGLDEYAHLAPFSPQAMPKINLPKIPSSQEISRRFFMKYPNLAGTIQHMSHFASTSPWAWGTPTVTSWGSEALMDYLGRSGKMNAFTSTLAQKGRNLMQRLLSKAAAPMMDVMSTYQPGAAEYSRTLPSPQQVSGAVKKTVKTVKQAPLKFYAKYPDFSHALMKGIHHAVDPINMGLPIHNPALEILGVGAHDYLKNKGIYQKAGRTIGSWLSKFRPLVKGASGLFLAPVEMEEGEPIHPSLGKTPSRAKLMGLLSGVLGLGAGAGLKALLHKYDAGDISGLHAYGTIPLLSSLVGALITAHRGKKKAIEQVFGENPAAMAVYQKMPPFDRALPELNLILGGKEGMGLAYNRLLEEVGSRLLQKQQQAAEKVSSAIYLPRVY